MKRDVFCLGVAVALVALGCGGGSSPSDGGTSEDGGLFCEAGSTGCFCFPQIGGGGTCNEANAMCIADTCVDCVAHPDQCATTTTCGAADLCGRSLGECAASLTMEACVGFYDPATTTCADIDGYTTCNCACLSQTTCDAYFSCGMTCFEDWC